MKNKKQIDKYLFEDNIKRLCLYDMLRRKDFLQDLTLKELDTLVHDVKSLLSNLEQQFKEGTPKIEVSDKDNWSGSSLFRDIFVHTVLDVKINYEGTEKEFKDRLKKRWLDKPNK